MKLRVIFGYLLAIAGLILLVWNAYLYLSDSELNKVPVGVGLILCSVGAVLLKRERPYSGNRS